MKTKQIELEKKAELIVKNNDDDLLFEATINFGDSRKKIMEKYNISDEADIYMLNTKVWVKTHPTNENEQAKVDANNQLHSFYNA